MLSYIALVVEAIGLIDLILLVHLCLCCEFITADRNVIAADLLVEMQID